MATFDIGETVVCSIEVKTDAGILVDPATSMKITIISPPGSIIINAIDMTKNAVGKYYYDFASASQAEGEYIVKYTATDGSRITIEKGKFRLEV